VLERDVQKKLLEYLKKHYPDKSSIEVLNLKRITEGWETEIYCFTLKYGNDKRVQSSNLILRIYYGDYAEEKAAKEFKVMKKLYEAGFPVPKVHHLERDISYFGKPFVIMEKINGKSMGEILEASSEKVKRDMVDLFCRLLVKLHRLDVKLFTSEGIPMVTVDDLIKNFQRIMHSLKRQPAFNLFEKLIDWLKEGKLSIFTEKFSPVHLDFHPHNILIRSDGKPFVVDWTNFIIIDYRVDLAWTLLLVGTYNNSEMRNYVLKTYEKISGIKVEDIEYFEALATFRRLGSIYISLSEGAERVGMRPEVVRTMKQQKDHIRAVIRILSDITGIAVREFNNLLML